LAEGEELERSAIERCDRLIYTSDWAANSAIKDYGADPSKVRVVPRGGDLGGVRTVQDVLRSISVRGHLRCELLLIGVSWERKGGALAAEVLDRLQGLGVDARLTVVGCEPPAGLDRTRMEVHPFLDKGQVEDLQRLLALFERSHFLLVPSMAECFGIVYAEASGIGLPSLARDTGGVSSAVRSGINGMVFPAVAGADVYAEYIAELWNDRPRYEALCLSAHQEFLARLNWDVVGRHLEEILREVAR
jgi:glycosyltransferase involved in cell wall biosynthesis